ncbi:MAG: 2-dehydro-3-deoxyphosphooctonate aldolase synthase [Blastocatellia bacterium]|jgi:2-dehydro-3-deoxyphosphooctonate aldolase (KDO 8-P synthase)|nr:2-dehydro-3-deoxyphosphooctonate aldolase synthase [Blastocatellia bacterium]
MGLQTKSFQVGSATFGDGRLTIIAGPCVIESAEHALMMARECAQRARDAGLDFVFKSSFDKANRSSVKSFRGVGMQAGLDILRRIKGEVGVPVVTDIHDPAQVERVAEVADILQIPAFLCRQTDLILAAAGSGRAVNIKKGQFLAPEDARNIVEKAQAAGCEKLMLTERGVSFGYNNLVVDMRSFPIMSEFGVPVVFDVTHSLQLPGGLGNATGGLSQYIEPLARAGVACGVDAVFMEVHDAPERAPSDGPNMLPLARMGSLLENLRDIHRLVSGMPRSGAPLSKEASS